MLTLIAALTQYKAINSFYSPTLLYCRGDYSFLYSTLQYEHHIYSNPHLVTDIHWTMLTITSVEVVVGKNTTPLLTDAQPLLSGQVLMFVNYNGHTK
jgi:hypothetical protein